MDAVSGNVEVAGSQQIRSLQYGIFSVHGQRGIYYLEVTAGFFPDLQAFGFLASVVIVVRCAPEVRLDTEAFIEIFRTFYLVGSYQTAGFVEGKVDA